MKILVTGSSGMVGKNLMENLKNHDFHILSPSRNDLDLFDNKIVKSYLSENNPELIIHCAGQVGGIQANMENQFKFIYNNIQIGKNIIKNAHDLDIQNIINLGSSCMYPRDIQDFLCEEDLLTGELEPTNEGYALSKIVIAKMCQYLSEKYGRNYKTLIPCNLYGKWDKFDPENSHMIPAVIRKIHKAKVNNIYKKSYIKNA